MNEGDVRELALLIKLHMSQGELYYIEGLLSTDANKVARALLIDGKSVYSISK